VRQIRRIEEGSDCLFGQARIGCAGVYLGDEGDSDGLSSNNGETSKIEVFRASSKDGKSKATEHGLFAAKCPKRDITQRVKPILLAFITDKRYLRVRHGF
jgi:hypothetical protein